MWSAHGVVSFLVLLTLAMWLIKRPPLPKSLGQVSNSGELGTLPLNVWCKAICSILPSGRATSPPLGIGTFSSPLEKGTLSSWDRYTLLFSWDRDILLPPLIVILFYSWDRDILLSPSDRDPLLSLGQGLDGCALIGTGVSLFVHSLCGPGLGLQM